MVTPPPVEVITATDELVFKGREDTITADNEHDNDYEY